jgi:hypothetical protein
MVGEEDLELPHEYNTINESEGKNGLLKPKENFERSPHLSGRSEVRHARTT